MNELFLDIETIPTPSPEIRAYIAATIKPPKTMSVAATIEKWHKESKEAAVDDAVSSTGLDGAFGNVCVIGFETGDSGPQAVYGLDEYAVLTQFNNALNSFIERSMFSGARVVGHNLVGFDLRFLLQRYIVNGIRPHPIINVAANAKSWADSVYDTMTQFAGYGKTISLDKLCTALGVPTPKGDIDGSMVGKYVADGRIDEVVAYCKKDVAATKAVYRRMTFADCK